MYLNCVLTAGAGPSLDEGVSCVDDPTDAFCVGVQLRLEGLVLLVLTLSSGRGRGERAGVRTMGGSGLVVDG